MNKKLIFLILLFLSLFNLSAFANYNQFKPSQFSRNNEIVIEKWNSKEGIKRLEQSKFKDDFYQLANFFQPQINPLYCGMASSVIILNALKNNKSSQKELEVKIPKIFGGGIAPFKSYSQLTFLNKNTDKVKKREIIELKNIDDNSKIDPGVTLQQLSQILNQSYDLKVNINYVTKVDYKELMDFRKDLKEILNDKTNYILANFMGKTIGLKTGGHISPLVAYDQISDSILVLDVAGHHNSWYWIKLEDIYRAMNTKDGDKYRGYLIVRN